MSYQIFQLPPQHPLSAAGRVLPGSKAYFYLTETDTPVDTYQDADLSTEHANPVVADAGGRFPTIYLDPEVTYKVTVTDSNDVLLYTIDPANDQSLSQEIVGGYLYPRTSSEISAGVSPSSYAYPPGDIRRYGAQDGENCDAAFESALTSHYFAYVPERFTALVSTTIEVIAAGTKIVGGSRYTSIIQCANGWTDANLIAFPSSASSTFFSLTIYDLYFKLYSPDNTHLDVTGVNLSSINNSHILRCRFEGKNEALASQTAQGVVFDAPLDAAAYSNTVQDCNFIYCDKGIVYGGGANANRVIDCEILACNTGINAAPGSYVDSVFVMGCRIEACGTGILEGSADATYIRNRFEDNDTADMQFTDDSSNVIIIGGSTADSATPIVDFDLAVGSPVVIAPDLFGRGFFSKLDSDGKANELFGPNVMAPRGDAGTALLPTGGGTTALFIRGGRLATSNNQWHTWRDAAGTGVVFGIIVDSSDRIVIGSNSPIKLNGTVGFQGTDPISKPTVSGSRGGNAALASLLTALANYGLITDSTS